MTICAFWELVDVAREASGGDIDAYGDALRDVLADLSPEELTAFDKIFGELLGRAYRWDLWGAAYVINGGCSDDGFVYFRAWLVMQGREIYERSLEDPDSLARLCANPEEDIECEDVLYVAGELYEEKTGSEMEHTVAGHGEAHQPQGQRWEEDELATLLPKLTAIHWAE